MTGAGNIISSVVCDPPRVANVQSKLGLKAHCFSTHPSVCLSSLLEETNKQTIMARVQGWGPDLGPKQHSTHGCQTHVTGIYFVWLGPGLQTSASKKGLKSEKVPAGGAQFRGVFFFWGRTPPIGSATYQWIFPFRATSILGYLPQELLGTSAYEYYHFEDLDMLSETHRKGETKEAVVGVSRNVKVAPSRSH